MRCPDTVSGRITDRGIRQYFAGDLKNVNPSEKKKRSRVGAAEKLRANASAFGTGGWLWRIYTAEGEQVDSLEYTDMSFVRGIFFHTEA